MSQSHLIIHAPNIHQGGGAVLLNALLTATDQQMPVILHVDARMQLPPNLPANMSVFKIKPTLWQRLLAEWRLSNIAKTNDTVLCFGNLPPLFKNRGKVMVYVQNRYLAENTSLQGFPLKVRLRISIERIWFVWRAKGINGFIVQTASMQGLLQKRLRNNVSIQLLPFVEKIINYQRILSTPVVADVFKYDFIYAASGEPHKNHRHLIETWCLLAQENLWPKLCITLDPKKSQDLLRWIAEKKSQYNLAIENVGLLTPEKLKKLYSQSKAVIYPSLLESFGLPLIEAREVGLPVLAGELDFVRDILDPEQTFDPQSPLSIARAVKRFLGLAEKPLPLLEAQTFLQSLLAKETL